MSLESVSGPEGPSGISDEIERIVRARQRQVGNFQVRRLLPARGQRTLGPFVFFDHMGPHALPAGRGVDVPPHPHIELATVTYLFEGELVHRDSLGSVQAIRPGDVNWMHAGQGIVHSERTGSGSRAESSRIHGVQLWVALPKRFEQTPPRFEHYSGEDLPVWTAPGVRARVLVGRAFGCESPVETLSETLYIDAVLDPGAVLILPRARERGLYVVNGELRSGEQRVGESDLVVFSPDQDSRMRAEIPSRVLVLGGDPIDGERHIWWNFVSSSAERIERAKLDWQEGRFPPVPGDELERTPLPPSR